jgi:hypothetical protein
LAKFLLTLILVTALILAAGVWSYDVLPGYFYQSLIFLLLTTIGLFRFLLKTKQQRPDFFVQFYLGTLVVKLIAFGIYIFLMAQNQPGQMAANVVFFMAVYVIFTALEIGFLYRHVSR